MKGIFFITFNLLLGFTLCSQDSLFMVTHQNPDVNDPVTWEILSQDPDGGFYIQDYDEFNAVIYTNNPDLSPGYYSITVKTTDTRTDPGPLSDTKTFIYPHNIDAIGIDVITPDGGEVFRIGDPVVIRWQSEAWVHIELYKQGNWYNTIEDSTQANTYTWITSKFYVDPGSDYTIKIKEWEGGQSGYSEAPFTMLNNYGICDTIPITIKDSTWGILYIDTVYGWIYNEKEYLVIPEPIQCIYNDTIPIN